MNPSAPKDLTERITALDEAGALTFKDRHIEVDRIYRGITMAHVRQAIANGAVTHVRMSDKSVFWQGKDLDGRVIEINITLKDEKNNIVVGVSEAKVAKGGTAYDPKISDAEDKKMMADYLSANPDWEERPDKKGVQRKLTVVRV